LKILRNRALFILGDCILVNIAVYVALLLRFEASIPSLYMESIVYTFILTALINVAIYYSIGLYSRLWAYASIEELFQIFIATAAGLFAEYYAAYLFSIALPRSVYLISWLIVFFLIGGFRLSYRFVRRIKRFGNKLAKKKRIMIVGAGDAGSMLIKEIKSNKQSIYEPVAAIDDDESKHRTKINGVFIVGGRDKIVETAEEMDIDEILIAIPSIPRREISNIINICKDTRCKLKVLPGVYSIVNEEVSVREIRDINIEDLLGREKITLNTEEIAQYIKGETVLVTGGGGSIGSELCRQIARYSPRLLLIFDNYENNAYELQNELLFSFKDQLNVKVLIGSVRDRKRLEQVFSEYRPAVVFHAAAHKHVPLMEENPQEAIKNNVFGTINVAECADRYSSKRFVLISTDKAVNPANIMGATKRIAEMIIQNMDKNSDTIYTAVRFGNVLGSNGSVIPLFMKQIERGGPVTVTHPQITRFFMTISEAASLVIQAGAMAGGGEIFVLDMGEPVKIVDLANALITLSGLEPGVDIDIEYTGLRPGEKLYEELLITEEGIDITKNQWIFIEKVQKVDFELLNKEINLLKGKDILTMEEIKDFIKKVVPTYRDTAD
jgi:FlaA1/EpsC-like NDP-sugar epimerase